MLCTPQTDSVPCCDGQAIKQKLQIGGKAAGGAQQPLQDEQDKARMLLGSLMAPGSEKEKPGRKPGLFHHLAGN